MTGTTDRSTDPEPNSTESDSRVDPDSRGADGETAATTNASESAGDDAALEWSDGTADPPRERTDIQRGRDDPPDRIIHSSRPTVKPVVIWLGAAVVLGGSLALWFFSEPQLFGDPQIPVVLGWVTVLVSVIVGVKLLVQLYVLTRTRYVITDSTIRHEFSLWYRRWNRELPVDTIRGVELEQDRIQAAIGVGNVAVLTGGTDYSLGYIEFLHIPDPDTVRTAIRECRERN